MDEKTQGIKRHFHPLCMLWAKHAKIAKEGQGYTLTVKGLDPKVLYSASRPKKFRSFILAKKFMSIWIENPSVYEKEPPEIAIVYSKMPMGADGIAHGIPIVLSHPVEEGENSWKFQLAFPTKGLAEGHYRDIALFIDWLPSVQCPGPIAITFPNMYE